MKAADRKWIDGRATLLCMAVVLLTLSPSGLKAQVSFPNLEKNDLIAECLANENELSDADSLAIISAISEWKNIFATKLVTDTKTCLLSLTGEEWIYSGPRAKFVTLVQHNSDNFAREQQRSEKLSQQIIRDQMISELARIKSTLNSRREEIIRDLQQEATARTYATCVDRYEQAPSEAILSPICNPYFLELGLPDSNIQRVTEEMVELSNRATDISMDLSQE
tara:strand:+ start:4319 stop:4987 length:669 start_codon:yes stop_codon:yes gene_type:complete